ncbi:MAG: hypothetical protein JWP27_2776 [Flaviaesturariibacter sp.]|nr:hypothetical protein [Flaviaesturariibacter sp.]
MESNTRLGEGFLRRVKAVVKDGHHPADPQPTLLQQLHNLQAALARGNEVLYDNNLLAGLKFTLDLVAQSMLFRLRPYINERKLQLVRDKSTPGDACRCHTCHQLCAGKLFENNVAQFALDEIADIRMGQDLAVIAIDGTFPAAGPGERLGRAQFHSLDLQQLLGSEEGIGHGAKVSQSIIFAWKFSMHKIHFESKTLVLGHLREPLPQRADPATRLVLETHGNSSALSEALRRLQDPGIQQVVLRDEDPDTLLKTLESDFTVLRAAGGFVYTPNQKILLIFRRGKWDLPKGKLDEGESLEQCALREIGEETGATNLEIESSLLVTRHTYAEKGKPILKESHWYIVRAGRESALTSQTDEDIEQCIWADLDQLGQYLGNTHGSITDVIDAGLVRLNR